MSKENNGLPIIIDHKENFSVLGIISGTAELIVHDNGTNVFPTTAIVKTNKGGGSINIDLSGNMHEKKTVHGITVEANLSKWKCTDTELSFHVKITAKKLFVSKTLIDKTLSGKRNSHVNLTAELDKAFAEAAKQEA
ncbi:MAG: hypothetical protein ACEPOV_00505 [Hyphomicrobiales bacterium]